MFAATILFVYAGILWERDIAESHAADPSEGIVSEAENGLLVRSSPDPSSSVIGGLPNGTEVTIQDIHGDWGEIQVDGSVGYISLSYVTLRASASDSSSVIEEEVIAIDPGHGGKDAGAEAFGLQEKEVALDIGQRVQEKLEGRGAEVVMTRTSDVFVELSERARIANEANASSFISIHANAAPGEAQGTETFHYPESESSEELASYIQEELLKELGTTDRGVKSENFSVLSQTDMPAVLAEVAFIDHESDA